MRRIIVGTPTGRQGKAAYLLCSAAGRRQLGCLVLFGSNVLSFETHFQTLRFQWLPNCLLAV